MRQTPLPVLLATVLLPAIPLGPSAGCRKEADNPSASTQPANNPSAPAPVAADMTAATFQGVSFAYPTSWKAEKPADGGGFDLKAPAADEDADWQPGMFLDVQNAPTPAADLDKALDSAVDQLRRTKTGFRLVKKQVVTHPAGFKYGLIEYANLSAEQVTPLTQWELIIPMGNNKRLLVQAITTTDSWARYQPEFSRIIDSIRPPGGK